MMPVMSKRQGLLWSNKPIGDDPDAWVFAMKSLLEEERQEEKKELVGLLSTMSPSEAEAAGLSLVSGVRILERTNALFGRTKFTIGRKSEAPLPSQHRFRVGSEVQITLAKGKQQQQQQHQPKSGANERGGDASRRKSGVVCAVSSTAIQVAVNSTSPNFNNKQRKGNRASFCAGNNSGGGGGGGGKQDDDSGDEDEDDDQWDGGAVRVDPLANETTHKRVVGALDRMARYGERRGGGGGGGGGGRSSGGGCGGDSEESAIHSFPALQLRQVLLGSAPLGRVASTGTAAAATATATATDSGGGGGAVSGGGGRDAAAAAAADTADAAAAGVGGGGVCDVAESSSLPLVFNEALDSAQREAVTFALESTDVALIHGPPGTGKTTTLVELLLHLVLVQGCKVLLCAPSNVAVDNLLERLVLANPKAQAKVKQQGLVSSSLRLVRLGHPARLTAAVAKHSLDALFLGRQAAPNKKNKNKNKGDSAPCLDDNADEEDGEDAWGGLGSSSGGSSEVLQGIREDLARVEQKLGPRRETEAAAATATASKKKSCKPAKGVVRTPYERKTLVRQARELRAELQSREKLALKSLLSKANVVCCTCVGAAAKCLDQMGSSSNAKGGQQRGFDVCVIDEAAMALEASCWIPILRCKSLILAGDHCQLPPVVKSAAAVRQGLARTLFERLLDTHDKTGAGESRVASSSTRSPISRMLTTQYRMHLDISDWASQAMYGGQLVAAERVRGHTLGDLLLSPTDLSSTLTEPPIAAAAAAAAAPAAAATATSATSAPATATAATTAVAAEKEKDPALLLDWECVRCPLLFIDTVGCGMFEDGDGAEEYLYATPFSAQDRPAHGKKKKEKQTKKGGDGGDGDGDGDGDGNDGDSNDKSDGVDGDDDCGGHTSVVKGAVVASRSNGQEAAVVVAHVKRILRAGLDPKQVAVISPYNGQVDSIRRRLVSAAESATKKLHALATMATAAAMAAEANPTSTNVGDQPSSGLLLRRLQREAQCASVEVKSVDGFQGAEREALVLSLVRSNANGDCGFVKDPRRLNVAVTRARRHCCVVGDSETFTSGKAPFVAKLLEYIEARGKVVSALETLPDDDDPPPHLQTAPPPPTTPPGAADEGARCGAAGAASDPPHGLEPVPLEAASSSQATDDSSKSYVVVEKDGAATSSHAPLSEGCSTTLPSARVSSLSSPIAPLAFSALEGLADLRQGSEYLAHRPKDTAVLLKVKYKSRIASVAASLDETVGCLRARAAAAHGLDLFFAPTTGVGAASKFLKLLYKGVLGDDTQRLRDSKVKAGASIILLVSGAPPVLLAAIAEKEAGDSAVAAAVAGAAAAAAAAAVVGAVQPIAQSDSALVKISDVDVVLRVREFAALAAPATTEEEGVCLEDVAAVAESSELPPPTQPKQALVGSGYGGALRFPPTLSPHQRRLVHELAETLNLGHESTGEGGARSIAVFHLPNSARELPTTYHEESDKGTGPGFEMEAAVKTGTAAAGSKSVATTSNAASSARVCKQNGSFLSGSDRPSVDEKKLDLKALHFERQKRREASAAVAAAVATSARSSDSALSSSTSVVPGRVLGSGALNDEWTMPAPSSVTPPLPKGKQSKKGKPRKLSKSDDGSRGGGVLENTTREVKKKGSSSSSSSSSPEANFEEEDDEMAFLNSVLSSRKDEEEAAKAKAKKDPAYGWKRWVDADGVLHHPQAAAGGGGGGRRDGDAVAQGFDDGSDQAALRANLKSSLGAKQESRQKVHQNKKGKSSKKKK